MKTTNLGDSGYAIFRVLDLIKLNMDATSQDVLESKPIILK